MLSSMIHAERSRSLPSLALPKAGERAGVCDLRISSLQVGVVHCVAVPPGGLLAMTHTKSHL